MRDGETGAYHPDYADNYTQTTAQMLDLTSYPSASKDVFQTMVEYIYYKDLDLPDKNQLVGADEAYVKHEYNNTDRGLRDGMYKHFYGQCFLIYGF